MDTKTFYGTRPHTRLALIPENPQDSDADLTDDDDDPTEDPDQQSTQAGGSGGSSSESLDEEEAPSTSTSSTHPPCKKSRKGKGTLKPVSQEEPEDTPDPGSPSGPNKGPRRVWKHEDIEEFKVPNFQFEPPEAVHTPFQYF